MYQEVCREGLKIGYATPPIREEIFAVGLERRSHTTVLSEFCGNPTTTVCESLKKRGCQRHITERE